MEGYLGSMKHLTKRQADECTKPVRQRFLILPQMKEDCGFRLVLQLQLFAVVENSRKGSALLNM